MAKHQKREEKNERREKQGLPPAEEIEEFKFEDPEPQKEEKKKVVSPKKGKKVEIVEEVPRITDETPTEIKEFGRFWTFANYFNEEDEIVNLFREGGYALGRVNPAVITDMDDHYLLQGFGMITR